MTVDLTTMRTVATTFGGYAGLGWIGWLAARGGQLSDTAVTIIVGGYVTIAAGQVVRSTVGARADAAARQARGGS